MQIYIQDQETRCCSPANINYKDLDKYESRIMHCIQRNTVIFKMTIYCTAPAKQKLKTAGLLISFIVIICFFPEKVKIPAIKTINKTKVQKLI